MSKKILSIGEATLDAFMFIHDADVHCTVDKKKCEFCVNYADKILSDNLVFSVGGNAANTAVSFKRLGLESQLFSVRGDDWIGQRIQESLEKEKVDMRYIQVEKGPSSYTSATVFQGERNLIIYHVPREYHLPNFDPVEWVYLTSMGKAYHSAYDKAIEFVKRNNCALSFNPGTAQIKAGAKILAPILEKTTILFVNVDEARLITNRPNAEIGELSEALYDFGPQLVVITDGAKGAYSFGGTELLFCEIFPMKVVERTGAGDSFAAGFTAAMLRGKSTDEAMRWGMANSAGVVSQIGPQAGLLTYDEIEKILESNKYIRPRALSRA